MIETVTVEFNILLAVHWRCSEKEFYQHQSAARIKNTKKRGLRWHPSIKDKQRRFQGLAGRHLHEGYPSVSNHFDRKQEAQDWAYDTERQILSGKCRFGWQNQERTLSDLIDRYIEDGVLDHHKSAKDTERHLNYFKKEIGQYALVFLTPELLLNERKKLQQTPTEKGNDRTPSTVNRYFSSLGGVC